MPKVSHKILIFLGFLLCLGLVSAEMANAHRLNVFAWVENGLINVESDFGSGRPARNAEVTLSGANSGKVLAVGKTNESGACAFPMPQTAVEEIRITVNAGQGHQNTWQLSREELGGKPEAETSNAAKQQDSQPNATLQLSVGADEFRKIIREELTAARKNDRSKMPPADPGLFEIIGGLGWILGLCGIWLWFQAYRKKKVQD